MKGKKETGIPPIEENEVHAQLVDGLYESWFLDYASYVILERAVPRIEDGLKPVQRRIMHAIKEVDDGRFNKVANVIGNTMQYHPHGDAAIGEALVNLGQKNILFETQGNWGDTRTGDAAAAPRYIEVRLSKFALDVVYNPQTTQWQRSYDGRKNEPVTLPVKFPLLLAQGVEGIAVGLSTKILPHNFRELIKASIEVLKGKKPKIFPDFPTGGIADFSEYEQGARGGKVKVRARIEIIDKKTLAIREVPFATTTTSLIESIVKASEKGKIKVKKVIDNTAKDVEIVVNLQSGILPEVAIDALYAFTDCEISISTNACVIVDNKPMFMKVNDILQFNTEQSVRLLNAELNIKKDELMEKILFSSLEKIFIENRIYHQIEACETFEAVIKTTADGLKPFQKQFYRKIVRDDILKLLEIRIKRISKYDTKKADEILKGLEKELAETLHHIAHLTDYAIAYFKRLDEKYGAAFPRMTEISGFQSITATDVIAKNAKLYVNRSDGFVGSSIKKEEFVADCSELDDIIVIRKDGKALISKIGEKKFMGKGILQVRVWKKGDDRMVYNMIYSDQKSGRSFAKRFSISTVIRDKEYNLTPGGGTCKVHYLSANPNGEAEIVEVKLTQSCTARKKIFPYDFSELEIKGKGSKGNTVTKYPVRRVDFKEAKGSTLSGLELWFDQAAGRLNKGQRGKSIGTFDGEEKIIAITSSGQYKITDFDLANRYEPEKTMLLEKFDPEKVISAIYREGNSKTFLVKRFHIETSTPNKEFGFISDSIGSKLVYVTTHSPAEVQVEWKKGTQHMVETINLEDIIDIKGWKSMGNKLSTNRIVRIEPVQPHPVVQPDLFGDLEVDKTAEKSILPKKKPTSSTKKQHKKNPSGDNAFDVGDTIELNL